MGANDREVVESERECVCCSCSWEQHSEAERIKLKYLWMLVWIWVWEGWKSAYFGHDLMPNCSEAPSCGQPLAFTSGSALCTPAQITNRTWILLSLARGCLLPSGKLQPISAGKSSWDICRQRKSAKELLAAFGEGTGIAFALKKALACSECVVSNPTMGNNYTFGLGQRLHLITL